MVSTNRLVDTRLAAREEQLEEGVRQVDAAGRRWYTEAFKRRVVAECLQPDVSVTRIAVDRGLNPNLVRKWMAKGLSESRVDLQMPALLAVERSDAEPMESGETARVVIEVRVGQAVILINEHARPEIVRALVQSLR
jgi:transposase-like protein